MSENLDQPASVQYDRSHQEFLTGNARASIRVMQMPQVLISIPRYLNAKISNTCRFDSYSCHGKFLNDCMFL